MYTWQKFIEEMVGKQNAEKLQMAFACYFGKGTKRDPVIPVALNKNPSTRP